MNKTGGATHHFVYPLFFSFIDLDQIQKVGWLLWPIFKLNGGRYTFCSLDEKDHLQDWIKEQSDIQEQNNTPSDLKSTATTLLQRAYSFIEYRTKGKRILSDGGSIRLMAHLTYFGYCFNPISVFYCLCPEKRRDDLLNAVPINIGESKSSIESIIVEVSNTPWIEQHSYMLDESIANVRHIRLIQATFSSQSMETQNMLNLRWHLIPFAPSFYL